MMPQLGERASPYTQATQSPVPGAPIRRDWLVRLVWVAAIVLSAIGVAFAAARTVFVTDLMVRVEPVRRKILAATDRRDPFSDQRDDILRAVEVRYATHPVTTWVHVIPGGLYLLLAPFQFSRRIRTRHIRFHRRSGRLLLAAGAVTGVAGVYFGLAYPFAGNTERAVIAVAGAVFLLALAKAFMAIRRKDIAQHREWMIRAFAVGAGISTVRIAAGILDFALVEYGFDPASVFVASLVIGWGSTIGVAELWLKRTRGGAAPA